MSDIETAEQDRIVRPGDVLCRLDDLENPGSRGFVMLRDGEEVLSQIEGTVPGRAVRAVIPSASETADFDATFTLDDADRATRVVLTGPFYPDADDVTYTVDLEKYGVEKDITAP